MVKYAPIQDIVTKRFSLIVLDFINNLIAFIVVLLSRIMYPKMMNILAGRPFKIKIPINDKIVPIINLNISLLVSFLLLVFSFNCNININ